MAIDRDIYLPELPVVVDKTAVEPLFLPVVRAVRGDGYCGYQTGYPKFARRGSGNV